MLLPPQLCSYLITGWRCTCGKVGSLKTHSAPALQRSAGTTSGSAPWRRCCSTAKVRGLQQHVSGFYHQEILPLLLFLPLKHHFHSSSLSFGVIYREEPSTPPTGLSGLCRLWASHLHQHLPILGEGHQYLIKGGIVVVLDRTLLRFMLSTL